VIIPTFHRPRLLLRAVESVLNQTLREIEAIVVIDGEDPETTKALDSIGDLRLRAMTLPPGVGCAGARNAGVGEARGDWVAFLDDDDEWLPRKLEIQIQTARQSAATFPIVACRLIARSEQGDLVWPLRTPAMDEPISDYLFCQSGLRGGEGLILPSAILTTRDLLRRVPFRAELPRHNDVDWLLRASAVAGVRVKFVPSSEPLAVWHIETNRPRISNTADWQYSLDWIRRNRAVVTPRAYASFVLIWASSTAARGRRWKAFWILPREAFALGKPRAVDLLAHLIIWLVPHNVRSSLSVFLAGRGANKAIRAGNGSTNGTGR
jgi:glycosyltransferase involved in cell wall biosynthesis